MTLVDVNVLLYVVNRQSAHHAACLAWWEGVIISNEAIGLTWPVIAGFLRIVTKPQIFPQPLSVAQAISQVEEWIELPNVELIEPRDTTWPIFCSLLAATGTGGNLVTDCQLAAMAIDLGATLASCDHDFGRFPNLRWQNPAAI